MDARTPYQFLGITFADLQDGHCRYPQGEGRNILYCGQPQMTESPYCSVCHKICYVEPRKLNLTDEERMRRSEQAKRNLAAMREQDH